VATDEDCTAVIATVGLDALVEDRGGLHAGLTADSLSAGQKQLFSLARAILRRRIRDCDTDAGEKAEVKKRGGILLLDEVSSSVDIDTDRKMMEVIKREFEGYTVVMVSHRLEVVMDFDTVVVMDKGSLVEKGAPRTLVEKEGGRFRDLWLVGNKA
jgi:ATP-binding cassette, subfamily C (CFTR/MRP), member 1